MARMPGLDLYFIRNIPDSGITFMIIIIIIFACLTRGLQLKDDARINELFTVSQVLVSDCRFGVSPVNYPDPGKVYGNCQLIPTP